MTDALIIAWGAILMAPTALAFARGGPFAIGWWVLANLLLGWHPTLWIIMLVLARHRRTIR